MKISKLPVYVFNFYLNNCLLTDVSLFFIVIMAQWKFSIFIIPNLASDDWVQDAYSNLISTSISLAGFILAALTIIVTFKSSIQAKMDKEGLERLNGLELILSTRHYYAIIRVFKLVLFELIFVFMCLTFFWLFQKSFKDVAIFYCLIYSAMSISLGLLRTLIVLFKILVLDKD